MEIKVQGSRKEPYMVDTEKITCTCPHFKFRSRNFSIDNENRLCKHLLKVFDEHPEQKPAIISKLDSGSSNIDKDGKIRYSRQVFDQYVSEIRSVLQSFSIIKLFEFCGSYRRLSPRVSDLDVLLVLEPESSSPDPIFNYFEEVLNYDRLWRGDKKASYKTDGYIQIDFKIVPEISWPFALCHYTGSKEENIRLRRLANSKGLSLNEYGIYKDKEFIGQGIKTEQDLYSFLGIPYKSPYNR
jgi:DNA polymerase/3'-5' exonuclease PolX